MLKNAKKFNEAIKEAHLEIVVEKGLDVRLQCLAGSMAEPCHPIVIAAAQDVLPESRLLVARANQCPQRFVESEVGMRRRAYKDGDFDEGRECVVMTAGFPIQLDLAKLIDGQLPQDDN